MSTTIDQTGLIGAHERELKSLRLLWSSRQFLARTFVIGACFSVLLALLLPVRYESTTRLMPPDQQSLSGMAMAAASMAGKAGDVGGAALDVLGLKTASASYTAVLASRTVQDHIIDRFDLMHVYWVRYRVSARKKLAANTDISEDRKTGVVTVTVTDRDPKRAAAIAKEYVAELDRMMALLSTSSARRERIFLEQRLQVVKQELDSASKDLSQFSSKSATIDVEDEGKALVEAAATLQGQLIAAQSQLKALEQIYTSNNVRVKSLQAEVASLQNKLNQVGGVAGTSPYVADPNGDFSYPSLRQLPLVGVTYLDLYRRMKIAETVFEVLTKQYELARVEEAREVQTVKVLDEADVPERRTFPPRTLIVVLGGVMSLVFASFWVVAMQRWEMADPLDPRKIILQEIKGSLKAGGQQLWRNRRELPRTAVVRMWRWLLNAKDGREDER